MEVLKQLDRSTMPNQNKKNRLTPDDDCVDASAFSKLEILQ